MTAYLISRENLISALWMHLYGARRSEIGISGMPFPTLHKLWSFLMMTTDTTPWCCCHLDLLHLSPLPRYFCVSLPFLFFLMILESFLLTKRGTSPLGGVKFNNFFLFFTILNHTPWSEERLSQHACSTYWHLSPSPLMTVAQLINLFWLIKEQSTNQRSHISWYNSKW